MNEVAYTYRDATVTLFGYLGIDADTVKFIPDTSDRGFLYDLPDGQKCVIYIYPISHKNDDSKNFFDTRDSGAREREVAWNYAGEHGLKYFCLAVHDQVNRYKDYIFSLECDEKIIEKVSGTVNGERAGKGTQVVIPNGYAPKKKFERILTRNNFWIAVVHRDSLVDYLEKFDSRPYLNSDEVLHSQDELEENQSGYDSEEPDEYHRAAKIIENHIEEAGLSFDDRTGDSEAVRDEMLSRFSPDKLSVLGDDDLLHTLFYSSDSDNTSLCYFLEINQDSKELFGSISGGSAYKFILFRNKKDGKWTTGSPTSPEKLSDEQALELGKEIRDYLVKGADVIKNAVLETPDDYDELDRNLVEVTEGRCHLGWIHKYFSLLYPEKITFYHSEAWQRHILYALRIRPSGTFYGRDGQRNMA